MHLAGFARHTTPEAPRDLGTAAGLVGLRRSTHCLLWPLRSVGVVSEHHLWPGRAEVLRADRAARAAPGPGDLSATQLVRLWSREGLWANSQAAPRGRGQGRPSRGAPAPAARPGVSGPGASQDGAPAAPAVSQVLTPSKTANLAPPVAPRPPAVSQRCPVTSLAPTWPTLVSSSAQKCQRLQRLQKLWRPRQQSLAGQVPLPPRHVSGGGHTSRTNSGLQTL